MFTNSHALSNDPTEIISAEGFFTDEEVEKILNYVDKIPFSVATLTKDKDTDDSIRKSNIKWIYDNEDIRWLFDKMITTVDYANEHFWKFDLRDIKEAIQYTEYPEDGGHYVYHIDVGEGEFLNQRKVSVTIQLTDESDYDGGYLEILRGSEPDVMPKKKGSIVLFPSFLLHRVTPVTRGTRKSLVMWIGGGSFK
jgi:PKHD-type hydroxylase